MKNFLQQKFPRMKFQDDTALGRRGFLLILEILIFLAVFYVGQTITSIPVAIFTVIALFTDETFMEIIQNTVSSSDVSLTEYMEQIQEVTVRITEKILLPTLFCTVLATIVCLLYCRVLEKRPLRSVGFRKGHILREYLIGLLIGGGMFAVAIGLACFTGSVEIKAAENVAVGMIVAFFVGYLLQGMSEEVLCRGYFMVSMARRNKMVWAVLVSSIAFSLLHLSNPGAFTNAGLPLINIALFGVLEALYFLKRGDIWGAAAIHSAWNFVQGNIFGVSVSGTGSAPSLLNATVAETGTIWNGGAFGLEGGLCVTLVLVVVIAAVIVLLPTNKDEVSQKTDEAVTVSE